MEPAWFAPVPSSDPGPEGVVGDGVWDLHETWMPLPHGASEVGPVTRVRWRVTERMLTAERVDLPAADPDHVAAAFAITEHFDPPEHFDIPCDFCAPPPDTRWFARRCLRIDWSQNLVDHMLAPVSHAVGSERAASEPVAVFINNPMDPNAPIFLYDPAIRTIDLYNQVEVQGASGMVETGYRITLVRE